MPWAGAGEGRGVMADFGDARLPQRFWGKVQVAESGCWEWTASKSPRGYGYFNFDGKNRRSHRVSYKALRGVIPCGLELDHLCRNTSCVHPMHLEAVTHTEYLRRGLAATHARGASTCRSGLHNLVPGATYTHLSGKRRGKQICIECKRASQRRYKKRERAKLLAALKGHGND